MKAVVILALLAVSYASIFSQDQAMHDLFGMWKAQHNKEYADSLEELERFTIFSANYLAIQQWNAQGHDSTVGLNQFADLTSAEFKDIYASGALYFEAPEEVAADELELPVDLPTSFDWRSQGAVTPVKNQGQCGGCWAFSTTGALEGLNFVSNQKLDSFSEQQLIDCVTKDLGCNGGLPTDAFAYTAKAGIELESTYPFKGVTGKCQYQKSQAHNVNSGSKLIATKSSAALQAAAYKQPVSIGVEADQLAFQFYSGGVLSSGCGTNLDHAILVVGWDTVQGKDAWIVKNSWGPSWGNSGYLYMSREQSINNGAGVCGILLNPSIPTH